MKTIEILEKVKNTIITLTPAVVATGAIWGWDGVQIATATETFVLAGLQYAQFWLKYNNKEGK